MLDPVQKFHLCWSLIQTETQEKDCGSHLYKIQLMVPFLHSCSCKILSNQYLGTTIYTDKSTRYSTKSCTNGTVLSHFMFPLVYYWIQAKGVHHVKILFEIIHCLCSSAWGASQSETEIRTPLQDQGSPPRPSGYSNGKQDASGNKSICLFRMVLQSLEWGGLQLKESDNINTSHWT